MKGEEGKEERGDREGIPQRCMSCGRREEESKSIGASVSSAWGQCRSHRVPYLCHHSLFSEDVLFVADANSLVLCRHSIVPGRPIL